jgi:carboxymethylenebutenolidase
MYDHSVLKQLPTKEPGMHEREIEIVSSGSSMVTFVAEPDDGAAHPLVLVFMPATGLDDNLRSLVRELAQHGYRVAAPDTFHREGRLVTFDPATATPDDQAMVFGRIKRLTDDMVLEDAAAVLEELSSGPEDAASSMAAIGFCMGGRHALRLLAARQDRVILGVGIHPSFLSTGEPDSPHLGMAGARGDVYLGLGGADRICPPEMSTPMIAALEREGVHVTSAVHPGADHAYFFPGPAYDAGARAHDFAVILDHLGRCLGHANGLT